MILDLISIEANYGRARRAGNIRRAVIIEISIPMMNEGTGSRSYDMMK